MVFHLASIEFINFFCIFNRLPRFLATKMTRHIVRARIVALRTELTGRGLDAGPVTIAWQLGREGLPAPSTSTVRRVLHAAGLIVPEPRKRPRSSWIRFEAAAPNECWQSDFTHWRLADGSEVEIISWLDDHSRYLLACTAFRRVAGDDVVATFSAAGDEHGWPAATLTDNGSVYTSRFTGGRNGFEYLLAYLGIRQKNGAPGHPQTQGKVERFHQTLKRWLRQRPAARTLPELQAQLDAFRLAYDEERPHWAVGRRTPGEAYRARPKAYPAGRGAQGPFRLRSDLVDRRGRVSLRRGGRMHHLGIGAVAARRRVLAIIDDHEVTVVALGHGRGPLLAPHRARAILLAQPTTRPRPMAGVPSDGVTSRPVHRLVTDVPTHLSPMSRLMTRRRGGFEPTRRLHAPTVFKCVTGVDSRRLVYPISRSLTLRFVRAHGTGVDTRSLNP
jgi:transposase InsO family protein